MRMDAIRNNFLMKDNDKNNMEKKKNRFRRSGFTLVELIVVMIILSILLTLSVMGILAWQDWSRFRQQNEYAQDIFVAAQNQLNEYSANGKLKELYEYMIDEEADDINLGFELTEDRLKRIVVDESLNKYNPDALWPESVSNGKTEKQKYQDKIISVRVDKDMYSRYKADPAALKNSTVDRDRQAYVLFELIGSYIYDSSILEKGSICIEFTPRDGQVFSVFYSDHQDSLNYNRISDQIKGDWTDEPVAEGKKSASLIDRSETYRKANMVGFYSVDTLYASTKNQIIQPKLSKVLLHNEETFYLSYQVTNHSEITQYLKYDIEMFESASKQARLKLTLDGTKIKNEENQESIPCPVLRNEAELDSYGQPKLDANGNVIYKEEGIEIGTFPILAYIDKDKTVHVIFDAADVQAQSYLFKADIAEIYGNSSYASTADFARSYSFFRFGIDPGDYYVSIVGYGTGFKSSNLKRSNIKNSTFESISKTVTAGTADYEYKIKNPRHLYNVRFIEDLAYEQQAQISTGVSAIDKVTFEVVSDIDVTTFQKNGFYYDSYSKVGDINLSDLDGKLVDRKDTSKAIAGVTNLNCDFPSITRLRVRDVFDGNDKSIIGYGASEISNVLFDVYCTDITDPSKMTELKPVGLFNINYGEIKNLTLDDLAFSGTKYIGSFTGINAGTLDELKTANTNDISHVTGLSDVGGILGYQLPLSDKIEIKNLENRATVEGVKAVGGILGMVRNDNSSMTVTSLPGIASIISEDDLKALEPEISIKECTNYGSVLGSNKADIKGVFSSSSDEDKSTPVVIPADSRFKNDKAEDIEARYIGGIVGYCYNKYEDETKTGLIKIESCLSSPQMGDVKLKSILENKQTLAKKLRGVYIGGISGYNHFCEINNCSTRAEKGKEGYLFGYRYVGGIVGMNMGPASGIKGADAGKQGTNENHVIAYEFAGGITGCNADVLNKDSLGNDIASSDKKDPEKLIGLLVPDSERSLYVKIENWLNKGLVIATNAYSGGITGYNAGWVFGCNSSVEPDVADKYFASIYSGDYTGGISGYNNGIIGNTERTITDKHESTYDTPGEKFSTVCYVKGHNYVGGIVGYNDVDSIVEDYEVASGYVLGDEQSCFVGGYAGLNASLDLLMDQTRTTARLIHSNPNKVSGTYCVGGNIGGNIINTNNHLPSAAPTETPTVAPTATPTPTATATPTASASPSAVPSAKPSGGIPKNPYEASLDTNESEVYAMFNITEPINQYVTNPTITIYNNSDKKISFWHFNLEKTFGLSVDPQHMTYDSSENELTPDDHWTVTIPAHGTATTNINLSGTAQQIIDFKTYYKDKKLPVTFFTNEDNKPGEYWGYAKNPNDCTFSYTKNVADWGAKRAVTYTFSLKNNTDKSLPNWRIDFELPDGLVYETLDDTNPLVVKNGNRISIMPRPEDGQDYKSKVNPGAQYDDRISMRFVFDSTTEHLKLKDENFVLTFNNVIYSGEAEIHDSKHEWPNLAGSTPNSDPDMISDEGLIDSLLLAADEKADVTLNYNGKWGSGSEWFANFVFAISNKTTDKVSDWRIEMDIPAGGRIIQGDNVIVSITGTKFIMTGQSYNNSISAGGEVNPASGQICFTTETARDNFFTSPIKLYWDGETEPVYIYEGDNPSTPSPSPSVAPSEAPTVNPSVAPSEEPVAPVEPDPITEIYTYFKTDNFLGVLEGSEFVGGFVGYNLLFDEHESADWIASNEDKDLGGVYILQKKIVDSFKTMDESVSDAQTRLIKKKEIFDDLNRAFNITLNPSEARIYVSGRDLDSTTTTTFGSVTGDIYVGGVLGYNDGKTKLYIKNVENATPVIAKTSIPFAAEQIIGQTAENEPIYRSVDYKGDDKEYLYSYAGGIIGEVTRNIEIDHCWNAPTGDVQTHGTYTGGLCEINDGKIFNCDVSNFGSSVTEYIGGLCGLNKYMIYNCNYNKKTVSGKNVVGGIAAENFGNISNITFTQPKMIVEGATDSTHDGVCGLFAAVNGSLGTIEIENNLSNISVVSKGRYVGAITGYNQGTLKVAGNEDYHQAEATKTSTDKNIVITGSITGYKAVGGFIGCNDNVNTNEIVYFTNDAKVTATHGDAGGIVGINKSGEPIRYCVNNRVVSATEEGNAGGITATNNSIIEYCYDYTSVNAPNGITGGIAAFNDTDGSITDCYVGSQGSKNIEFISSTIVGGIAAKNNGFIADNTLSKVTVTNYKTTTKTEIGTVVGRNMSDGEILIGDQNAITECKAIVETNESKVGGIAGSNEGYIHGTLASEGTIASVVNCDITLDLANYASIGGIAGHNTGVIENLAVDASIEGNLGSDTTGYGGIVGYSGYRTPTALEKAQEKLGKSTRAAVKPNRTKPEIELDYPARIENCTFDGTLHAAGSSGQPARIGGIAGYNMYGSKITKSHIGTRATDIDGKEAKDTMIYAGKIDGGHEPSNADFASYAYISGCTGENYGYILACENAIYSTDTVLIFGYGGETAGLAGNNYGLISGYKAEDGTIHYLSTGKNWSIEQRFADNDHGPGGIVGIYKSTEDIIYVQNHASVTCRYQTNNKTGGILASLEQYEIPKIKLSYVENYGDVHGYRRTGGFISQIRSKGADFEYCKNFGNITNESQHLGGFIGRVVDYTVASTFMHCENHGNVGNTIGNKDGVGGFVGAFTNENKDNALKTYFYDCVNTGIIEREAGATDDKVGNFVGEAGGDMYLDYCRNYNTCNSTTSATGFVRTGGNVFLSNCFNDGKKMFTDYSKTNNSLPFRGTGTVYNGYYLAPDNDVEIDTTDYGVLADLVGANSFTMTYNGMGIRDLPDNTIYLAAPSDSNYLSFDSKTPKVRIDLEYDATSQGIDGVVFYMANNITDLNAENKKFTYTGTPTFYYSDGTNITGDAVTVTANRDYRSGEMILKNPSNDKKPSYVVIAFKNINDVNTFYRGMAYIPAANSSKRAAFGRYIVDTKDVTFTVSKVSRLNNARTGIDLLTMGMNGINANKNFNRTKNSDVLAYDFSPYENMSVAVRYGDPVDIYIDGNYKNDAKGMKEFIFYLASEKTGSQNSDNQYNYYYDYFVEFTDVNGNTIKTQTYTDKIGYYGGNDPDLTKSEQRIVIPSVLDSKIATIHLNIQYKKRMRIFNGQEEITEKQSPDNAEGKYTENGKVYLHGFKYVPEGEEDAVLMNPGRSGVNAKYDLTENPNRYTKLSVSHSEQKTTVYAPTNPTAFGFDLTYPENNPVGETYYKDLYDYKNSLTEQKNSGSRVDVFYDLDPKLRVKMHDLNAWYYKLLKPTNLKYVEKNGGYRLTWDKSFRADSYELYYEIKDTNSKTVLKSDVLTFGKQITSYDVPIEDDWKTNHYHIQFYVKAINGYHYAHEDKKSPEFDSNYTKYDSDWASSEEIAIEKQALPTPKIHWEIVNGNRTTFVLDNYDEYEALGCTNCTIYFTYRDQNFTWDLSQEKYRKPEKITMGTAGGNSFFYKAVPNEEISNYFVESNSYRNLTEAHGNDVLASKAEYTTTIFKGFYGATPEEMRYEVQFKLPKTGLDTYQMTDISAYDKAVGATVIYSNEITHTANSSGTTDFNMNSVLKNLPVEWFDNETEVDSITVRAFPYHSQFDMVYYGHEVDIDEAYLPLKLDGTLEENEAILSSIIDDKYFAADEDTVSDRNVYDINSHDMNPGYLLTKQSDGTYTIFYSSVIDMSMDAAKTLRGENAVKPYQIYSNYDVAYKIYQNPYSETKETSTPVKISQSDYQEFFWIRTKDNKTNAEIGTITTDKNQEIQTAPIFESIEPGSEDGIKTYTVIWDKYFFDKVNYDTTKNRYNNPNDSTAFGREYANYFATWKNYVDRIPFAKLTSYTGMNANQRMRINNAYWSSYSNAEYIATLYGKTFDDEEVQLQSHAIKSDVDIDGNGRISLGTMNDMKKYNNSTVTTLDMYAYQTIFKDTDNEWSNYPYLYVRLTRLGSKNVYPAYDFDSAKNQKNPNDTTMILPRYSQMGFDVKLKLNTISKPSVILKNEDGLFVTTSLEYTVKWGAITDEKQKDDLGGYLITVKPTDANEGDEHTKPHYYYVDENSIHLNKTDYADGILTEIVSENYVSDGDNRIAYIDLSDFNKDEIVSISVKAIAKETPTYFEDGDDGVETEITIPDRLLVPDVNLLQLISDDTTDAGMRDYLNASCIIPSTYVDPETGIAAEDEIVPNTVDTLEYSKGVGLSYNKEDVTYADQPTAKIAVAVAVFDQKDAYGAPDTSMHASGDYSANGTTQWNRGAYKTLYTKEASLSLGYASAGNVTNIDLLAKDMEAYPGEFAGKWLKIVAKAESSTRIDSQWTDQDMAEAQTINALWIHLPKLLLADITIKASDCNESDPILEPVQIYETKNGIVNEVPASGTYTTYDIQTVEAEIDPNVEAYTMTLTGKMRVTDDATYTPVYQLFLQRSYDAENEYDHSWDMYLKALGDYTDISNAQQLAENNGYIVGETIQLLDGRTKTILPCISDEEAIYIGNLSSDNAEMILDDLYAKLGSKENITLNTKLQFITDESGVSEGFRFILPDILTIDGKETTRLKDTYIGIKSILIHQVLSEEVDLTHVSGRNMLYRNIPILQDDGQINIWQKQIRPMDQQEYTAYFENLAEYFEQEKLDNEKPSTDDSVSGNSI